MCFKFAVPQNPVQMAVIGTWSTLGFYRTAAPSTNCLQISDYTGARKAAFSSICSCYVWVLKLVQPQYELQNIAACGVFSCTMAEWQHAKLMLALGLIVHVMPRSS